MLEQQFIIMISYNEFARVWMGDFTNMGFTGSHFWRIIFEHTNELA